MLIRTKESPVDRARSTLRDVVSYAQDVARDERLRADLGAALDHGAKASDRVSANLKADGISTLASDRKLRKNLRAMLDELDDASDRLRRKNTHRLRNSLLVLAAGVAALFALAKVWPWLTGRASNAAPADIGAEPLT